MIDLIFGRAASTVLSYLPYAVLFLYAFRNSLRFSPRTTIIIVGVSTALRICLFIGVAKLFPEAVCYRNYLDLLLVLASGGITVKSNLGRILFVGLMLKNTADAVVVIAKFLEYLANPTWAFMYYHWTYSVSMLVVEILTLPIVYLIIARHFSARIRDTISRRWRYIWIIPFFFYLTWLYVFYFSSKKSDMELACMPIHSVFLMLSIVCQHLIYVCIASLIENLQKEADLQAENHAMQIQSLSYHLIQEQISEDRRLRHDLKHHFAMISSLVENKDYERLSAYVQQYIDDSVWQSSIQYCANTPLNLMATYFANKCAENHITCSIRLNIPKELPLNDNEITVLFGNLLENAYHACVLVPAEESPRLSIHGDMKNNAVLFSIENSYGNEIHKNNKNEFKSTKHAGYGIGIPSCVSIVEKHGGSIDFVVKETFVVNVYLAEKEPSHEHAGV